MLRRLAVSLSLLSKHMISTIQPYTTSMSLVVPLPYRLMKNPKTKQTNPVNLELLPQI
jgi:hypothetical protein